MSDDQPRSQTAHIEIPVFEVIECAIEISRSASLAWGKIGSFGLAGKYLSVSSEIVFGDGDIGSVRTIGDSVAEVMVQKGPLSYTYTQSTGPMTPYAYHGSVAIEPIASDVSRLTYTISFDPTLMTPSERDAAIERIRPRFQGMIEAMKIDAEAN